MHSYKSDDVYTLVERSLNPCFNGRCTRTERGGLLPNEGWSVLILVLMEDALVQVARNNLNNNKL